MPSNTEPRTPLIEGRHFAAATMIGGRKRQEDAWSVNVVTHDDTGEGLLLAAVADGMGGLPAGDQASRITIRNFTGSYPLITKPPVERLRPALAHANHAVRTAIEADPSLRGMGSTLVAALFLEERFHWLSVGDSHIFHWRGDALERVNPLHTYGRELDARAARGEISAMRAALHPQRAAITSAVMGLPLDEVAEGECDLADRRRRRARERRHRDAFRRGDRGRSTLAPSDGRLTGRRGDHRADQGEGEPVAGQRDGGGRVSAFTDRSGRVSGWGRLSRSWF